MFKKVIFIIFILFIIYFCKPKLNENFTSKNEFFIGPSVKSKKNFPIKNSFFFNDNLDLIVDKSNWLNNRKTDEKFDIKIRNGKCIIERNDKKIGWNFVLRIGINNVINLKENYIPIFFINLDKDKNRLKLFESNMKPIFGEKNLNRISGVIHNIGKVGCRLAHIDANIAGINSGYPYYLICEDDILPLLDRKSIKKFIYDSIEYNPDLVLFEQGINLEKRVKMSPTENKNLFRITANGNNAGCYLCKREFGIKLIKLWMKYQNQHIDISWQRLWKDNKIYFHKPQLFIQNEGYSNQSDVNWRQKNKPFDWSFWKKFNNN